MSLNTLKSNPENNVDAKNLLPDEMAFNETEKAMVKNAVNDVMPKLDELARVYVWKKWWGKETLKSKEKKLTKEEYERFVKELKKLFEGIFKKSESFWDKIFKNPKKKKNLKDVIINRIKNDPVYKTIENAWETMEKVVNNVIDWLTNMFKK